MGCRARVGLHSPCGSLLSLLHLALVRAQGLDDACRQSADLAQGDNSGGNTHPETHTRTQNQRLTNFQSFSLFTAKLSQLKVKQADSHECPLSRDARF